MNVSFQLSCAPRPELTVGEREGVGAPPGWVGIVSFNMFTEPMLVCRAELTSRERTLEKKPLLVFIAHVCL